MAITFQAEGIAWHLHGREKYINMAEGWEKGGVGQDEAGEAGRGPTTKCFEVLVQDFCRDSKSNGKP